MRKKVVVFIFKLLYSLILSVGTPLLAAYFLWKRHLPAAKGGDLVE